MSYKTFLIMMILSFIIMYTVMFLNVDSIDHVYLSTTRFYMALLMVSPMAIVMLLLMGKMYPDKKLNTVIITASLLVFIVTFFFLRNQTFVSDKAYMKAMIPHHSSAILTSKHANIKDPEVRKLAEGIIQSQEKEIAEMKEMLNRIK
jgi:hypothetical protein